MTAPDRALALVPFVHRLASRFYSPACLNSGLEYDDLVQEGIVGLLRAAERFDPSRGATLLTFAYPRVRGMMLDAIAKASRHRQHVRPLAEAKISLLTLRETPDQAAHLTRLRERLRPLLAELDVDDMTIVGHILADARPKSRAADLNLTYPTYLRRRHALLQRLRTSLSRGEEPAHG